MNNRIREVRKEKDLTLEELADRTGIELSHLSKMEKGTRKVSLEKLDIIARALGVRRIALLEDRRGLEDVEIRGHVQAGEWREGWEWEEDQRYVIAIPRDARYARATKVGVEVRGDSMSKRFPCGSVVVLVSMYDLGDGIEPGRRYLVERERADGLREYTVKQLVQDPDGHYWLRPESDDPSYKTIPVDGGEGETVRLVARVIGAYQRM